MVNRGRNRAAICRLRRAELEARDGPVAICAQARLERIVFLPTRGLAVSNGRCHRVTQAQGSVLSHPVYRGR